uniref:Uncharacterized protein n=1 Tax=Rhizophora mucronata TaxID=61149 RepID=A0A2P2QAZ4_RHIMU
MSLVMMSEYKITVHVIFWWVMGSVSVFPILEVLLKIALLSNY